MLEVFSIYKWTLVMGLLSSAALSLIGAQMAARNQALQSLVMSQAAHFGVVLALGVQALTPFHSGHESHFMPLFAGLCLAGLLSLGLERLVRTRREGRNAVYVSGFIILTALSQLTISLSPQLDTHSTALYFGDLTLTSDKEAIALGVMSFIIVLFVLLKWTALSKRSFQIAVLGPTPLSKSEGQTQILFFLATLTLITISMKMLGQVFTIGSLFIPILFVSLTKRHIRRLPAVLMSLSALGNLLGFTISAAHGSLPTTSTMIISICVICLLWRGFLKAS